MNRDEILQAAEELGIHLEFHSYKAVPSKHCFGSYNIPKKDFEGSDDFAELCRYPLEVTFFYRENKLPKDFELEEKFEEAVRAAGEFSCTCGYNSSDNLFFTQYIFNIYERL